MTGIDEKVKGVLVKNFKETIETIEEIGSLYLEMYQRAKKPEDIIAAKRDYILAIIRALPHGEAHCYFCKISHMDCNICPYGKVHMRCGANGSSYDKVSDARREFERAMYEFHEDEQKYDELPEKN